MLRNGLWLPHNAGAAIADGSGLADALALNWINWNFVVRGPSQGGSVDSPPYIKEVKMASVRKTRRRPVARLSQDRRVSDILAAASEVISAKGYEGVTMAEVAERANIVEGTVYRYFKNKDDLLMQVAEEWFTEIYRDRIEVGAFSGTYNKLRYLIWHSLKTVADGPSFSRYLMMEVRPRPDYKETALYEINREYTGEIRKLFREAIASGEFKSGVPERLLRDMVFGTIEHSTWRFLRGEGDFDLEELAEEITMVVYQGMAAHPPRDERTDAISTVVARLEAVADRLDAIPPAKSK